MNLSNYSLFSNFILAPFCLKIKEFSSGMNSNSAPTISDLNKFLQSECHLNLKSLVPSIAYTFPYFDRYCQNH